MKTKHTKTERLSMLDDIMYTAPKDWLKRIRAEIQHLRQAHSKAMNKDSRVTTGMLDLTPAMEKRRTAALLSSLEKLPPEQQAYADDWITLNIFSESYAPLQFDAHMLTAASIWILDKLSELDSLHEYTESPALSKLYTLLPTDDELLDDLFNVDIWDCRYDEELITSVEYVLHYRNQDIAPLESNGGDDDRVLTSNLAAEGKDHADVPSRKNFEEMLSLLPQWMKDDAVKQFEECYQAWCDRFFTGIAYMQEQYTEKRNALNEIRKEINELRDKLDKRAAEYIDKRKQTKRNAKKVMKGSPPNILMMKSGLTNEVPPIVSSSLSSVVSGFPGMAGVSNDGFDAEIRSMLARLKELDDLHDKGTEALDNVIEKRGKFLYMIVHHGYLSSELVSKLFPEEMHSILMQPIPVSDPYELCFALLYLVETGSDIPWLYGSCIGMMSEVVDYLPWALSDYEELEDPYWVELPPESRKTPDLPNWYSRDYVWKGDDEYDARSLAQIVYEATGCLMPRDLHRYDAMLKDLGKYGIKQNKAIAMLYCILNLLCDGSTKNKSKAYAQVEKLLNPPFVYDYENQVSIFSQLMGIVADDVQSGAIAPSIDNPPPGYIDEFVALWSHYQERHRRSGRSPEAELNMMHESYAFAHYTFLERYIEKKLQEGYQGAYWAYGFVFSNQCNHLLHPVNKGSKEYDNLETLFMNGLNNNDLGALRAIPELYYVEKAKHLFSQEMLNNSITRLKDEYPEEYASMISDLEAEGIVI